MIRLAAIEGYSAPFFETGQVLPKPRACGFMSSAVKLRVMEQGLLYKPLRQSSNGALGYLAAACAEVSHLTSDPLVNG